VIRGFLIGLAYIAGLVGCGLAMHGILPRTAVPMVDEKLSRLLVQPGEFDTVFIGSSRVYHQFIPEQFDATMRGAGYPMASFNYGVDGMLPPESFFAVDDLLRRQPKLRWVFIELAAVEPASPKHYAETARAWWWHDWTHTELVVRANLRDPRYGGWEGWSMVQMHGRLMANYYLNLGRGAELLEAKARARRPDRAETLLHEKPYAREWIGEAGFVPPPVLALTGEVAQNYEAGLADFRVAPATVVLAPEMQARVRALAAAVRAAGATPVFVITPSLNVRERIGDLRAQGIDADMLAFNDATAFPALYEAAARADNAHLNDVGAREFTRLLAERFAALQQRSAP
jgi:hypothetical protein